VTTWHSGRLEVEVSGARAVLTGRLDDSVSLGELPARLPTGAVTLDTSGITFVNSIGMREWMRLTRALRDRGDTITLERVADVLMTQLNLFGDLARMASIASFHAQYVCPACGAEATPVVDVAQHATLLRAQQAPHLPCPECRAAMELGDFPERYLSVFKA
jgi:hypothetical protein